MVGALVGAAAVGALLGWAGAALGSGGLDSVGMMAVGILLGSYLGTILGCWAALRALRFEAAQGTAVLLIALGPIGIGAGAWLSSRAESTAAGIAALMGGVALAAVLARLLAPRLIGDDFPSPRTLGPSASSPTDRPDPPPYEAEQPFGPPG